MPWIRRETLLPKAYDPAFDPSSITKVAVHESGKLCAEVAVLPQNLTVCGKALKAGFLGMVSVHPKFRGQGHMKALMQMWTEEARSRYDMLVLYGQRQRYEYFGFTGGGMRRQFFVEPANIRHALKDVSCEGFTFRPFFEVEGTAAFAERLNRARLSFVERKAEEMELIFRCLNQKATAILKDGKLAGYLISRMGPAGRSPSWRWNTWRTASPRSRRMPRSCTQTGFPSMCRIMRRS